MGARLIVTIVKDGKDVCNVYMHWSAYSRAAIWVTQNILNIFNKNNITMYSSNGKILDSLMEALPGSRPDEVSLKLLFDREEISINKYCNISQMDLDRNDGIISFDKNQMKESQDWSKGDVYIELSENCDDNHILNFGVCEKFDSLNDIPEDLFDLADNQIANRNYCNVTFDKMCCLPQNLKKLYKIVQDSVNKGSYFTEFKDCIVSWYE